VADDRVPALWGGINLGDEARAVVLVNLSCGQLAALVAAQPAVATVGELAARFFRAYADYPLVRLRLAPGEGYHLPRGGLILGGDLEGKQEVDVQLCIQQTGGGG